MNLMTDRLDQHIRQVFASQNRRYLIGSVCLTRGEFDLSPWGQGWTGTDGLSWADSLALPPPFPLCPQ